MKIIARKKNIPMNMQMILEYGSTHCCRVENRVSMIAMAASEKVSKIWTSERFESINLLMLRKKLCQYAIST